MFSFFRKKPECHENKAKEKIEYDYNDIEPIAAYFKATTGIGFESQLSVLKSKLTSFCRLRDIRSYDNCLTQVKINPELEQDLINYLTTNESFFYREFGQILRLVGEVKAADSPCDILCLPCSTGEEPYSIVIALLEENVNPSKFSLLGVDISTEALQRASEGIYNERNISRMPKELVEKYFKVRDDKYHLNNNVKSMVKFKDANLFSPAIDKLGKFDYILSRNMLIYFDADIKIKASKIMERMLNDPNKAIYYGHADLF